MSLINDALKRTKQAQQQNPPPPDGPALKPADPAATKSASNTKSLLYIMVACVIIGNALLFFAIKDRGTKKETAPANPPSAPVAVPPTAVVTTPQPPPVQPAPAPVAVVTPAPTVTPIAPDTNAVAAVAPEPPKPAPLKLQSIIYNPSRPSAMVSGKFLFIGDKVQGFRVTAINQETVTLVGNNQTNVLSLP